MRLPPARFGRHPLLHSVALHGVILAAVGWMELGHGGVFMEPPELSVVFSEAESSADMEHEISTPVEVPMDPPVAPEELDPTLLEAEFLAEEEQERVVDVEENWLARAKELEPGEVFDRVSFRPVSPLKVAVKVLVVPPKAVEAVADLSVKPAAVDDEEPPEVDDPENSGVQTIVPAVPDSALCPEPVYPRLARRRGWQGVVRVWVSIDVNGEVIQVRVEQSSGHALLDQAALDSVRKWKFIPANQGGIPVAGELVLPIRFSFQMARKTHSVGVSNREPIGGLQKLRENLNKVIGK